MLKLFISILICLLFYDEITLGELFSHEDKYPRLRLTTLNFNCYNCYFKRCYSSKTVCCYGTTLQRRGLKENKTFYFYLIILCFLYLVKLCHNLKFPTPLLQKNVTFLHRVYNVAFTIKYQRCSSNVVFLKSFACVRTNKRVF